MLPSQFAVKFPMKFVSRFLELVMSQSSGKNAIVYLIMYALNCKKENVRSLRDQFRKMWTQILLVVLVGIGVVAIGTLGT